MDHIDKLYFVNLLRQQKIRSNLKFYCYVLLPGKFSFIMETSSNNLTNSMHRIRSDYANYFNRRHNRRDKLFRDRYTCYIIEKKNFLGEVSYYLHLLPKQDGVTKSLFQYKWSSLPGYINKEKREDWVDYDCILSTFKEESQKASLNYQKYIKKGLKKQIASPFENLGGSIILGSKDFKKEIQKKYHSNKTNSQGNEDAIAKKIIKLATQPQHWSSLKLKNKKIDHAILSRNAAIYFLKKYTDLSNQQASTYFKSLKKSSISKMSQRFNLMKEKYEAVKKISVPLEEKVKKLL
ncbi:MAG: hypothetical protein HQ555_12910 [Candidatus Aminicenantes bacterium]|nr:hypothetical protein [Candidatus Aminicenantes bacterium]